MTLAQSLAKVGWLVRDLRQAIGWSQRELARRANVSQALVSAIESGRVGNVSMATLARLPEAMGAELVIDANRPFLGDRQRQRDPAHVHCTNQVVRRLQRAGWLTATEVEVGGNRSRGWIDVLACHPGTGVLLVIEVKTEIHDLGAMERTLGWYERESWAAARRLGWHPRKVVGTCSFSPPQRTRPGFATIARGLHASFQSGQLPSPGSWLGSTCPAIVPERWQ